MKTFLRKIKNRINSLNLSKEEQRHALVGNPKLWRMKRDFQIQFLKKMGLKPENSLLEVGCGTLRGGIPLIQYLDKGHYFGFDVREKAISEAREELKESRLEEKKATLICSPDTLNLNLEQKFDYIWAFSVLIHLEDQILRETLAFVSRHLADGGIFYANVSIGNGDIGNWQGFPVVSRPADFYLQACESNGLNFSDLGSLKEFGHITKIDSQDNQRMLKITKK